MFSILHTRFLRPRPNGWRCAQAAVDAEEVQLPMSMGPLCQYRHDFTSAPGGAVLIARWTNFGMNIWW